MAFVTSIIQILWNPVLLFLIKSPNLAMFWAPHSCHSHQGDAESQRIRLNRFASSFPIISFLFGSLASNTVFQTLSINRQNKDTKNDPVRRGRSLASVSSPHELVLTSPMVLEGMLSFTRDLGTSFPHISGTGSTLGEETARSELS